MLARDDIDEYERGVFEYMLEGLQRRVESYGDDAYPLTERQREWAERVADREKTKMTGEEFVEVVRETIGKDVKL